MKLLPAPNDGYTGLTHQLVSENNFVRMGVFRVAYGHRVRAGFCDDKAGVHLDWCGGGRWEDVERLYSLTKAILLGRKEDRDCFAGLPPFSMVKPFFLDLDFVKVVSETADEKFDLISLKKGSLNGEYRDNAVDGGTD